VLSLLLMMPLSVVNAVGSVTLGVSRKVVAVYSPTSAKASDGRTSTQLLQGANGVMCGFLKWGITPTSIYPFLETQISNMKLSMRGLVYQGGIGTEYLLQGDTWADGSAISQSAFNSMLARDASGNPIPFADGYLPDLASSAYRDFLVGWSKKQVDAGVDSMFFDGIYYYANYRIYVMGQNHDQTLTQYSGYFKVIADQLKSYAGSKGTRVFITLNNGYGGDIKLHPYQDFATVSFSPQDFDPPFTPHENWAQIKADAAQAMGRPVPIVAFIDWAGSLVGTPLSKLASLSSADQVTVLRNLDASTKAAGVFFAYPVYGGDTVYGKYDSVKYGTYNTIVALAKGTPGTTTTATLPGTTTTPHAQRVIAMIRVLESGVREAVLLSQRKP